VDVQVADAVVPAKVQVVNEPETVVSVRANVPVGVMNAPGELSVTVTLQVEPMLITTGDVQVTVVIVARGFTVILVVPVLGLWDVSPG
jgi:hypothetical protein